MKKIKKNLYILPIIISGAIATSLDVRGIEVWSGVY